MDCLGSVCSGIICTMTNQEIINSAMSHLNPHTSGDRLFGNVATTLVTENGNSYSGVY